MNKSEALRKAIEKKKKENIENFEELVESLVWKIENKSQELRDLKKELKELTFEDVDIPDVSDCIEE